MLLVLIILFSVLGTVATAGFAGLFLLCPERVRTSMIPALLSYATGALLGAALLGLLPEALEAGERQAVLWSILGGILLFFLLEKAVLWRHCHTHECEVHPQAGTLILLGDSFHNFVDGVIIAGAFLTSIPLGISTSVAVITHEIPQEVSDFALLLNNGYARSKAFLFNLLSGSTSLLGALLAYLFLHQLEQALPYVMAVAGASFLYIATADLVPSLHKETDPRSSFRQFLLILLGIATVALIRHH